MVTDVWLWEMQMCCSMHLKALREKLLEYGGAPLPDDTTIGPLLTAAPHDDTLFDSVTLYIKAGLNLHVFGDVSYWTPDRGHWNKACVIRSFGTTSECLEWLKDEHLAASEECARKLQSLGR